VPLDAVVCIQAITPTSTYPYSSLVMMKINQTINSLGIKYITSLLIYSVKNGSGTKQTYKISSLTENYNIQIPKYIYCRK